MRKETKKLMESVQMLVALWWTPLGEEDNTFLLQIMVVLTIVFGRPTVLRLYHDPRFQYYTKSVYCPRVNEGCVSVYVDTNTVSSSVSSDKKSHCKWKGLWKEEENTKKNNNKARI